MKIRLQMLKKRVFRSLVLALLLLLEGLAVLYIATHPPIHRVEVFYERY